MFLRFKNIIAKLICSLNEEQKKEAEKALSKRKPNVFFGPMFKEPRTYFPASFHIDKEDVVRETPKEIIEYLSNIGMELASYAEGKVKYIDGKRKKKMRDGRELEIEDHNEHNLGPILKDNPELLKKYSERFVWDVYDNIEGYVVISYHPHDIAGMSTDRNWTSCQDLNNFKYKTKWKVFEMIKSGGMVAYLVGKDDKNIEKPMCRTSIHRFGNKKGFVFKESEKIYGLQVVGFLDKVNSILGESNALTGQSGSNKRLDSGHMDGISVTGIHDEIYYINPEDHKDDMFKTIMSLIKNNVSVIEHNKNLIKYLTLEEIEKVLEKLYSSKAISVAISILGTNYAHGIDIKKYQDKAIESGDSTYMFEFAKYVRGADINLLQQSVINVRETMTMVFFAAEVRGADIKKLENAVVESGDAEAILRFAQDVKKSNIKRLEDAVIKFGSASEVYLFAQDIEGADIKRLEDEIIKKGDVYYLYLFAKNAVGADIKRLEDEIIKKGDADWIINFAQKVEGADSKRLMEIYKKLRSRKKSSINQDLIKISKILSLLGD